MAPEKEAAEIVEARRSGVTHKTSALRPVFAWC